MERGRRRCVADLSFLLISYALSSAFLGLPRPSDSEGLPCQIEQRSACTRMLHRTSALMRPIRCAGSQGGEEAEEAHIHQRQRWQQRRPRDRCQGLEGSTKGCGRWW